uniref:radical SAM protein n=1 Tax=Gelidibacter sp. TaxID=2018083 RepID=UPI00404A6814
MKKIFIKHNGCLNLSYDFNIAKSGLEKAGYDFVNNPSEADEIVFAGCGVRAAWVDDAIKQMNSFIEGKHNQRVVVTGCISKIETDRIESSLNTNEVHFKSFQDLVKDYTQFSFDFLEKDYSQNEQTDLEGDNPLRKKITPLKEKTLMFLDQLDRKYGLELSNEYKRTTSGFFFYNETEPTEIITVSRSCLYNCSFCTIPKGRGDYSSMPISTIKEKVNKAISKGILRIILIGDEVGNYGRDLKDSSNFKMLVDEILSIDKRLKIAIRYIEPTPFYKNYETIKKYCLEERIYLLHIPLQTGSQELLKQMNRNHNLDRVIPLYKDLTDNTNTTFYCNWMVGFPGETEEDFQMTIDLARHLKIQLNTVIPFSARPDTKAQDRTDKIPTEIIQNRCERLEEVLLQSKINKFIKMTANILIDEQEKMIELIVRAEQTNLKQLNG